jgi:hypothetical protein
MYAHISKNKTTNNFNINSQSLVTVYVTQHIGVHTLNLHTLTQDVKHQDQICGDQKVKSRVSAVLDSLVTLESKFLKQIHVRKLNICQLSLLREKINKIPHY